MRFEIKKMLKMKNMVIENNEYLKIFCLLFRHDRVWNTAGMNEDLLTDAEPTATEAVQKKHYYQRRKHQISIKSFQIFEECRKREKNETIIKLWKLEQIFRSINSRRIPECYQDFNEVLSRAKEKFASCLRNSSSSPPSHSFDASLEDGNKLPSRFENWAKINLKNLDDFITVWKFEECSLFNGNASM